MASAAPAAPRLVPKGGRVCIVGGGTSGIVAAKACLDGGLVPTVFEQTSRVGGVWRLDEAPSRVAYQSLYTNSSGAIMCISDFPNPNELQARFPSRQSICDYYEAYVQHFGLGDYVRFGTKVTAVRREEHHWVVRIAGTGGNEVAEDDEERELLFDAVFICTGQFRNPVRPELPGADVFRGRISHSAAYRDAQNLSGKRVVVVGNGNSALDISLEAARNGASVTVICRSFTNIIPVADSHGRPADQMLNTRFFNSLPATVRGLLFLRLVRGTNAFFKEHGMPPPPKGAEDDVGFSNLKEHVAYRRMVKEGRIKLLAGSIQKVGLGTAILDSGEEIPADEIILCTGYKLDFPFLAADVAEDLLVTSSGQRQVNAYKLIMHPLQPTLCVLGFLLTFGNESCVSEMQARWAVAHWLGQVALPSAEAQEKDLMRRRKGKKYWQFVPYVGYMDELAHDVGVSPPLTWGTLFSDPVLFWKLYAGPVVPAQYRLRGAQAWSGAADFIKAQPSVAQRWLHQLWSPPDSKSATDVLLKSKL